MTAYPNKIVCGVAASLLLATGLGAMPDVAQAHSRHRVHRSVQRGSAMPAPQAATAERQGVVGYFGPGAYQPGVGPLGPIAPAYGYGYGYGYGPPRADLGFALLGALNGGGFRGFVECGNYYARTPGACGF